MGNSNQNQKNKSVWSTSEVEDRLKKWAFHQLYQQYDKNQNGELNASQLAQFFTDLLNRLNIPLKVHDWQAKLALKFIDKDDNGTLSEAQASYAFRWIIAKLAGQPSPVYNGPTGQNNNQNNGQKNNSWEGNNNNGWNNNNNNQQWGGNGGNQMGYGNNNNNGWN